MENFTDYNNYNSFSYYPSSNLLALMLLCDMRYMNQDCYNLRAQVESNMRSLTMSISDSMINVNEQLRQDMQNTCCLQSIQAATEEIEQLKQRLNSCQNVCSSQYPDPIVTYIDELYANGAVYASISHSSEKSISEADPTHYLTDQDGNRYLCTIENNKLCVGDNPLTDCYKSVEEINVDLFKNEDGNLEPMRNMFPFKFSCILYAFLSRIMLINGDINKVISGICLAIISLLLALFIIKQENKA